MESEGALTEEHDTSTGTVWDEHVYKMLAGAAFGLLGVGTVVYHYIEGWSWVDALYFSTVAVTTVGFGDLAPSTDGSKLFTVVYILSGIAIIATFLRARLEYRHARRTRRRS
ncbi:MAG: potassium channel family protein [Actinomycetota bacterium]|nr:potassium channel family protein [Actinomycetota bacterium]